MFGHDVKKTASMIIGHKPEEESEGDQDSNLEGLHSAAQDVLKAVESKDAEELAIALHSFYQLVDGE